jgi:hypothetical protein
MKEPVYMPGVELRARLSIVGKRLSPCDQILNEICFNLSTSLREDRSYSSMTFEKIFWNTLDNYDTLLSKRIPSTERSLLIEYLRRRIPDVARALIHEDSNEERNFAAQVISFYRSDARKK